jgi:hypothetical protein
MSNEKLDLTEQEGIVADNNQITIDILEVLNVTQEETTDIEQQEEQP